MSRSCDVSKPAACSRAFALTPCAPHEQRRPDQQDWNRRQEHGERANPGANLPDLCLHGFAARPDPGVFHLVDPLFEHTELTTLCFLEVAHHDLPGLFVEVASIADVLEALCHAGARLIEGGSCV